jgi:hypothetical protein
MCREAEARRQLDEREDALNEVPFSAHNCRCVQVLRLVLIDLLLFNV